MATSHPLATTEWQPASTLLPAKGYGTNTSLHPTPQFFAEVSNRHLGINDLNILFKEVKGISHKWMQFAQSLKIKQDTIDTIQHDNPNKCEDCLNEVLKQWLRWESYDYMRYGIPCWRLVCEAVREGGGNPALAEKIADEHPQPSPEISSRRIYIPSEKNYKLANELFELKQEFSDVFYATKKSFSQELLSEIIDYLKSHIFELLGFERTKKPTSVIEEFRSITTISDLFDILQYNYLSWFNYKLIIRLVNQFLSSNDSLKDTWLQYEKKLEHYFMNSGALLKDAEDIQFGEFNSPPPGTKIIVVKVDREDYTLKHLFFLRRALPEKLNIFEYDLYLSYVYTNSLHLEYWIPDFLHSFIFPLSKEQEKRLASIGIVTMSDGDGEYSYDLNKFKTSEKLHHSSSDNTNFGSKSQLIEEDLKSIALASNLDFAGFSNRELGINDLDFVYNKVKSLSIKWILFAKSLHLESWQIKNLDVIEGHNLDHCMKKVVEYWLTKKEYKYKQYGMPCWRLVYVVVKEVGNSALAEEIAHEYPLSTRVTLSKVDERNFSLLSKLYELQMEFAEVLQRTIQYFNSKSNFPEIVDFLIKHIIASLSPHSSKPVIVQAVEKEFYNIQSIEELFTLLQQHYLSWFHFDFILKQLIENFLSTAYMLRRDWRNYEKKLNSSFSEQNIGTYYLKDAKGVQFGEFNSPPIGGIKVMVAKSDKDYTLHEFFLFCKENLIAKALNVPKFHIYFTFVHDSSLLEYWIPGFVYSLIFPLTDSKELAKIGIMELLHVPDMQSQSYTDFEKEHNDQSMESSEKPPEVNVCEQTVPEMEKESTTHNAVLHAGFFINGFKEVILLRNEPKTSNFEISLTKMKDTILCETIPCNFFLTTFLGLPFSRQSILVHNFLKEAAYTIPNGLDPLSTIEYNERGLSVYNATLMQRNSENEYLWFTLEKVIKEALSCSSAILSMSIFHDYKLSIGFNDSENHIFQDTILDAHFDLVCKSVTQIDLTQCNYELQRMLSSRMVEMNIIDDSTSAGVMKFLSYIFHHLNHNLGFVCLSLNDIAAVTTESKVLYIIRDALKMHSSEAPFIFIIVCSREDTDNDRQIAKEMLLGAIANLTHRLGLQPFKAKTLVLDPFSLEDIKKFKHELDGEVNKQCFLRRDIKLSWLFLRSALHSSSEDIVISYERLKDIAKKLGINEIEYKEFLEMFTNFMSILYCPSFKSLQNVVILRPVEFINTLSLLFDSKKKFNGIYTIEQINEIIPNKELADVIIDVLCLLGLAMKITSNKVGQLGKSSRIFLPLARSGLILEKSLTSTTSLFIIYESKLTLPDLQCFFASKLLAHGQGKGIKESVLQVESEHRNIFKIFLQTTYRQEYTFSFIFHDGYIEVACASLRSNVEANVFEYIFNCCSEALSKITDTIKDFSYKLALKCIKPASISTDSAKKEFEFFPQSKSSWCHQCQRSSSPHRKKWKELIEKKFVKEERRDQVNVAKLLEWAQKIGPHIKSKQSLNNFANQLSVKIDNNHLLFLYQECPPWQQVFTVFSMLEKRNEATQEKIKAALMRLRLSTVILD